MIDVHTAERLFKDNQPIFKIIKLPLDQVLGCTLAQDICADRDFPPFNRVAMDGFAFAAQPTVAARTLKIKGEAPAGAPEQRLEDPNSCIAVMTGAMLPIGCNTVIKKEDVTMVDNAISLGHYPENMHIHACGSDALAGAVLIKSGQRLDPRHLAILATIGQTSVAVRSPLEIGIISSGNEIVSPDTQPLPHQIRSSNAILLASYLKMAGHNTYHLHIGDTPEAVAAALADAEQRADALIFTGGVSVGKYDFIAPVLKENAVQEIFHGIRQRPGKPLFFGRKNNLFCIGLPGNPNSTLTCFLRYVQPWLSHRPKASVCLAADFVFDAPLTYFLPVRIETSSGLSMAWPIKIGGSGDMVSGLSADGFVELPEDQTHFKAGQILDYYCF